MCNQWTSSFDENVLICIANDHIVKQTINIINNILLLLWLTVCRYNSLCKQTSSISDNYLDVRHIRCLQRTIHLSFLIVGKYGHSSVSYIFKYKVVISCLIPRPHYFATFSPFWASFERKMDWLCSGMTVIEQSKYQTIRQSDNQTTKQLINQSNNLEQSVNYLVIYWYILSDFAELRMLLWLNNKFISSPLPPTQ